ncbi:BamA/TamA family outer membrane protein [Altericista sp. CCNU0014]|uniref:BamA/TamA family outer membrane protein n=1 Tax=Altericista sp. CCNU0014 TaxID=3082949 RepID=UPI00384A5327
MLLSVVCEVAQEINQFMTSYSLLLFRMALTLSVFTGAAAPLAAQTLSDSDAVVLPKVGRDTVSAVLPQSHKPDRQPQPQQTILKIAQSPTDPATQPTQVFPLPKPDATPSSPPEEKALPTLPGEQTSPPPTPSTGETVPAPTNPLPAPPDATAPAPTSPPPAPPTGEPAPTDPSVPAPPAPPTDAPPSTEEVQPPERQVLVSEVLVEGVEGELADRVYEAISTRPGQATTRSQLQVDINAIFATGYFSAVRAEPSDTPLGVRVTFIVQSNPVLKSVQPAGNQILTQEKIDEIFQPQYGKILNLRELQTGIKAINQFYQDKGYVLGQVAGAPQIGADGVVTLQVAEGVIEGIDVRYKNKDGEPAKGRTKAYIVTRELRTKPGEPLNRDKLQADLRRVFGLGLFEDVQVALEPGQDPTKVVVNLNVQERKTGNFSAGAGFSSNSGLFGTASYTQNNLGGNNQKLNTQIQVGTREFLFDASFTDPWIATDPYRTSYTVNLFNRLTRPLVFDGGSTDINLGDTGNLGPFANPIVAPNGQQQVFGDTDITPRVNRLGGGVTFARPLTKDPDKVARAWTASAGIQYQRISIRDEDFDISRFDVLGNNLSFSGKGQDDLLLVQLGLSRDLRNDPLTPTKGSVLRVGLDQSIPVGLGSITLTRLRASYSYFIPVNLVKFTKGPQALAFNVQGGTILGDLPPYEAFTLGGGSSVRGYDEGEVGSGRSFLQATAEYRFPLLKFLGGIGGVLFVDYGTNLGTQSDVPGQPGIVRGKPGDGLGYGVGLRVKTPIGPVRLDYGWTIDGGSRFQFGFGERF